MALCINQSGTWRNITTQCVNQSGTWRKVTDGYVNQSGIWRYFGMTAPTVTSFTSTNIVRCVSNGSVTWSTSRATSTSSNFGATATSGTCTITTAGTYCICAVNSFATSATSSTTVTANNPALGSSLLGGTLICASSNVFWIVAPLTGEVIRNWYCKSDAVTRAQQVSGVSGWFLPDLGQLLNPGYPCRTYWDSPTYSNYWSDGEMDFYNGWIVDFSRGCRNSNGKQHQTRARAFRCVTY